MRDYIEIKKELIPYQFNILLADQWFELLVDYNNTADMFTIALYKDDKLISVEPLVLNTPMFQDVYQPKRFPAVTMVPYSITESSITYQNLGESVWLTIDNEGEEGGTGG